MLSGLLWFTDSDYPISIFKFFLIVLSTFVLFFCQRVSLISYSLHDNSPERDKKSVKCQIWTFFFFHLSFCISFFFFCKMVIFKSSLWVNKENEILLFFLEQQIKIVQIPKFCIFWKVFRIYIFHLIAMCLFKLIVTRASGGILVQFLYQLQFSSFSTTCVGIYQWIKIKFPRMINLI